MFYRYVVVCRDGSKHEADATAYSEAHLRLSLSMAYENADFIWVEAL